jgi:uncharacterized protein (TIGR00251 family)
MAEADELRLREAPGVVAFDVRIAPRASREGMGPVHGGRLKVSVTAAPVDGAANDALIALLAHALHVPKGALRITRGEHGRMKTVEVAGLDLARVRAALTNTRG